MATKTKNPSVSTAIKGTTDKTEVENPQQTLTSPDASTPESDSLSLSQLIPNSAADDVEGTENGVDSNATEGLIATEATNDVDKKARRAERFGVPLHISEQEKRNSRADRFGTVSALDGAQSSEDLKRKARADRFCLSANANVDEDAKKKARLARFGSNVKVDTQEEEKRKARALRFASSPASAIANGKQNVGMENAVPGNTAGDT